MKECYTVVMLLFQKLLSIFKKSEENTQIKTDVCTINVRLDNVNFFYQDSNLKLEKGVLDQNTFFMEYIL